MKTSRFLPVLLLIASLFCSPAWSADDKAKPVNTPMVGKFSKVNGSVEIQKFGTQSWVQAKEGMEIGSGDQVASGIDGKAQIIFSNSTTDVQPLAQFSVGRNYETKDQYFTEVFLQVGKIKSDVEKNSGKLNKFTVTTPSSVCGIRGTTVESAFVPGVGAINTITDGAGYVAPVQADQLPPAIQQILNVPPSLEAREAAAAAAEKAGAPASVVAAIAAGAAPTEEARAVMAQIAVAGGASAAAAAAIEQGFGSFASIASSLTIPEAPVVGADVAPISAPAAVSAEPAATGMEAMVSAGAAPGEVPGGGPAEGPAGPAGEPGAMEAGSPMEGMAALLATIPGLMSSGAPEAGGGIEPAGGPAGAGEPGPGGPAGEPGASGGEPGAPAGEPGAPVGEPGAPGGELGAPVGEPGAGADPFGLGGGAYGPTVDVADGQSAFSPPPEATGDGGGGGGGQITPTLFTAPPEDVGGPLNGPNIFGPDGPIGLGPLPEPIAPDVVPIVFNPDDLNRNDPDLDNDGMPNDWEKIYGLNPEDPSDAAADADGDGYPNIAEFASNSRPNDGTDVPTSQELAGISGGAAFFMNEFFNLDEKMGNDFFDPSAYAPVHDRDGDGISNDLEVQYGLNPDNAADAGEDADADGFPNIMEILGGSSPADGQSVPNVANLSYVGLSPIFDHLVNEQFNFDATLGNDFFDPTAYAPVHDRDGDGISNDQEVQYGLNPDLASDAGQDADGDGFPNIMEILGGSDPSSGQSIPNVANLSYAGLSPVFDFLINEQFNFDATLGNDFFNATSYDPDFDNDGMYNEWEISNGFDPNNPADAAMDLDGDGYTNLEEFSGHSSPSVASAVPYATQTFADDDGDGLPNDWELSHGLNPNYPFDASQDPDGDGYQNIDEFFGASDPLNNASSPSSNPDVDGDGMPTSWELAFGFDPNNATDGSLDPDGDGFSTLDEFQFGSNPNDVASLPNVSSFADADGDGLPDNWEISNGLNPNLASDATSDPDEDGYVNIAEFNGNSNPNSAASTPTASTGPDADGDGMPNDFEMFNGFNMNSALDATTDADGDGYSNLAEFQAFSDPNDVSVTPTTTTTEGPPPPPPPPPTDNDGDGMPNAWEMSYGLNPNSPDASGDFDGDFVTNYAEFIGGSIPSNVMSTPDPADNDMDGIPNSWEITYGLNPNDPGDASADPDGDGFVNLQESIAGTDPRNPFVMPPHSEGATTSTALYDAAYGVQYSVYADGHRTFYNPDKAGTVVAAWAEGAQYHPISGYGYVNVGSTNFGSDAGSFPTILDNDGDGHSPQAAFMGTVFHDANDANFGTPGPQYSGAQPTSADPFHNTWANNPNPFHH